MKVILIIGSPHSGHEQLFELLGEAGLASALPCRKAELSPQALQGLLLRNHEIDLSGTEPLQQARPGKLWNELAADLFLTNINQPVWGWSDHQTAVLMDYWKEFDSQVRLVLVYNAPQIYLAQALAQENQPTTQVVSAALAQWVRWNTALLRYFHRHPEHCVLVNSQEAVAQPQALVNALAPHWQISGLNAATIDTVVSPAYYHLQAHLARQLIEDQHPVWALNQELEGSAFLPANPSAEPSTDFALSPNAAWADWVNVRTEQALAAKNPALESENQALRQQLQDQLEAASKAKEEQSKLANENNQLTQQFEQLTTQLKQSTKDTSQSAELQEENELLLLQLHQVQEELEHYFLRYQELEKQQQAKATGFVTDFWRMHQPEELRIDMRQEVAGNNWYPAEADGSWAGPATVSTIQMPPLQPGDYTLEMDVVDSMDVDIVRGMRIEALDQSLPVQVELPLTGHLYPLICKAQICIAPETATEPWQINLRFPRMVSPAESGSDDQRHLAMRLRTLRVIKLTI